MFLLSQIEAGTPTWVTALDATVLGLGLGMVMQVLILAVQNSVDHAVLGVATSGSTMFPSDRRLDRRRAFRNDLREPLAF